MDFAEDIICAILKIAYPQLNKSTQSLKSFNPRWKKHYNKQAKD
jgi:hypothetical protein